MNATGVSLSNCLFVDNHSTDPEAPSALGMRHAIVSSCTFYNNTSPNGHAVEYYGSGANFLNSIVWGSGMALSSLPVWNSVVDGGYSWGTNVIADDPMFVDPDGPDNDLSTWQDNDFSLRTGSPCIDSGHSDLIFLDLHDLDGDGDTVEQIPFDFVGNARRIDDPNRLDCEAFGAGNCGTAPLPDMGAFEGPPGAPLIIDQTTGGGCAPFVSTDADGDGVPDAADACDGFNDCLDADSDGTPDGCDACPNDPNKSEVGICGCGISDADSDEDSTPDCADGCPNDASKTHPGACGCGVSDTDIDNDGTADCNDVCLSDPNKTEAGQCGCGVADTDSDFDGVPDCNDGCPNDNAKTAPGVCGCGALETDLDADGTPNCNDHCPADPAKTEPGQCGCAVLETDTDNDGTADCNDNCPSDPYKTQPGQCGCSVVDTDTDSDGTSDCNDGCPIDPGKTAPGECGCSQVDSDADSDGTADCNDGCPSDPNKTEPGQCNCGTIDVDSDADGTADCNDGCPTDHGKTSPGVCGCGVPDIDSDLDGVLDCVDPCPNDPDTDGDGVDNCEDVCPLDVNKIDAGQCGCGNADTDSDSDGVADCLDGCPIDVSKIAPSQCGCGNPDTDTDGDGLANCNDGCPLDVNKIEPGICGCGVSDTDSDLDGTANCIDNCPSDPNKSDSGQCGCGIADTDTDIDGTADCNDGCPNDPNKIAVGTCGCGILDTDSDGDGEADCNDNCSADPNKTNPGPCGCGHADTDADGDGTADCIDGCPSDASKTAAGSCGCGLPETDGDGDGVADCVDNCPATVNPNQVDADNDGLGDVCDNQPPTAVTGPDQTINEGVLVSLDGGLSSDPDNDTISYLWTQLAGPAVALDTSDPIHPTFTAPTVPVGGATLTFQLVVSDGQFSSEPAAVNVVVKNVNHAPVALAGVDQTVGEAAPVVLSGADSYDADTDALTYTWTQIVGPVVTLSNAGTVEASFSAPLVGSGGETLAFSLTVSDGLAQSVDSVIVFVENVNHAPTANAGEDQTRDEGTVVALDGSASHDPDNDALSYSWVQTAGPAVALTGASTATPVFAAPTVALTQNETLSFVLTVDDGLGGTAADEVVITVLDTNAPPACELAEPSKPMLWPPNHKLIPFAITGASDPEAGDVSITIIAVTQDEPLNGLGDGDTAPDAVLQDGTVLLRAERAGVGNGRVYHIHFAANDGEGGTCVGVVTTCVPHDMGKGSSCIDDGQSYNSLAP